MSRFITILICVGLFGIIAATHAEGLGDEVVVVYNTRVPESKGVADHYAERRHVPPDQVMGFDMPTVETESRIDYRNRLETPLLKAFEEKHLFRFGPRDLVTTNGTMQHVENWVVGSRIRYVVLCYGVPLRIGPDPALKEEGTDKVRPELRRNEAAVDNELACLPYVKQKYSHAGPLVNPFFAGTNAAAMNPTNGILMVARLDGPTAEIARGLVDKAIQAETNGLWGRAYFDLRGLTNGGYKVGDDWIRGAAEVCRRTGFDTITDENGGTLPASFPLSQVAFYAGWYDENVSGPFTRPTVEFMPGAFAYHLHSFSAATLRFTTRNWVGPLLAKGATASMGCVDEPYLTGTPDIAIFFARFIHSGFSFGEAAYASQAFLSWQTTVVGDPLYRPFDKSPPEQLEAMEKQHSKLLDWYYLRIVNLRLANHLPVAEAVNALESLELTRQSAVLMEKLAELYSAQGKPSASVFALQQVLKLEATPQQRIRVMLTLVPQLIALQREPEAYSLYGQFVDEFPDYPDKPPIYRQLIALAQKLGKKEDAAKYEHELIHPAAAHLPSPKGPALRPGI
ncbi:MAG: hypothetical protein JWR19_3424 [Pedosphaera sp.]|nr:hypothetical protein [Pedosphaera sp.]